VTLLILTVYINVRLSGVEAFSNVVEITNLVPKVESMTKLRPGLNGAHFLLRCLTFLLIGRFLSNKKIAGVEDGLRRPNYIINEILS